MSGDPFEGLFPMQNKTYILLHGSWHASWCWRYVTPLLTQAGHEVVTPDLPGHGDELSPAIPITLTTYLKFVSDIINSANKPVTLVGHSMAGIIISQLAENMPEKIAQLIYIAAFIPDNNECLLQEAKKSAEVGISAEMVIDKQMNMISLKKSPRLQQLFYNTCQATDAKFALAHLQSEPFQPMVAPITISSARFGTVNKAYIECLQDRVVTIYDQRRMHDKITCEVISLNTDHSPFFSDPAALVKAMGA